MEACLAGNYQIASCLKQLDAASHTSIESFFGNISLDEASTAKLAVVAAVFELRELLLFLRRTMPSRS